MTSRDNMSLSNMKETRNSPADLVRLLRWLVPALMVLLGAGYPIIDHFVLQRHSYLDMHTVRESLILGSLGPLLMWLSLTWLAQVIAAQETIEETLARRNQELSAVNAVAHTAGASLELQTILDDALDQILAVTGVEVGEIFLLEAEQQAMVMVAHRGLLVETFREIERFPLGEGFPGRVAVTGQPLVTTDLAHDLRYLRRQVVEAGFGSYACVPLKTKGRVVGTLSVAAMGQRQFASYDLDLLTSIGLELGLAIANARLFEDSQKVATLEERDRLARRMHDGLVQTLSFLNMKLDTAQVHLDTNQRDRVQADLARMRQVVGQAYQDLRDLIVGLKETPHPSMTLDTLLSERLTSFQSDGDLAIELVTMPDWIDGLSPNATVQVANIVQEALTNVYKHAQARHAWVRLTRDGNEAQIVVEDDGQGILSEQLQAHNEGNGPHFGLTIMRERAESIGGQLTITTRPGGGARILVSVPVAGQSSAPSTHYRTSQSTRKS
jgi:nitrate/nitrite-specific signal transduction histidine kinase